MKFVLHEIRLWFREEGASPKSYVFLPNKVNVITGGATTGKTSFWRIMDYCLLSGKISIANTIVENVSWFGISFTINNKRISIARQSPAQGASSSVVCFNEGDFPDALVANMEIPTAKTILDKEFGITDALRFPHGKAQGGTSFNLSYRYFLLFNGLTEDIIGTSRTYFDTTFYGKDEYEKALSHIFDLIIGVNDMDNIKARERLVKINSELKKIEKDIKSNAATEQNFAAQTSLLFAKSKEFGFVAYDEEPQSIESTLDILNSIVAESKKVVDNTAVFAEIDRLNREKGDVKARLAAISRYQREFEYYKRNLKKCADSLQPIVYLNENLSEQLVQSYETKLFVDSLETSLLKIRDNLSKRVEEPVKVSGDMKVLNEELKVLETRINKLSLINKEIPSEAKRFIRLGELKNAYEQLLKRPNPKPIDSILFNQLNDEKLDLERVPSDTQEIKLNMKEQLNASIQRNYNQLSSLPSYGNARTTFNSREMVLQLTPEGQIFPLDNVGSKSNYMMMHLCFYLGLHEHMIAVGQEHVPQFLFIDQPSIPYYADGDNVGNADKTKLLDAFSLINSFVKNVVEQKKNTFQVFMVEHAPESYWTGENNLEYFHTVDKFVDGEGLIPSNIYKEE
ncbi:DUF3732 domain-containing protein [Pedobacter hiemivivus]|uniref:DUF3732 domain-containing protein n=1 Tax=Pedobacter hiemivivus TaxID=2530454 RepID=A0A4U1GKR6_9SPHI|nr:DUF3732 domain-containing protein [Pedobacter hiemivivus]TKC62152.1 DUF3732 domain-containing protein [Pedobacter hiemivivus]